MKATCPNSKIENKLIPVGLVATPDDLESLQDYLANFNGNDAVIAQTCAWMAWNLACKLTAPNDD